MEANIGNIDFPLELLKKHLIVLGSTGSGKTVLGKVLIEEAATNGIPSILIDPQGDLASLAIPISDKEAEKKNLNIEKLKKFKKYVKVVIFTPASSKGIPICINPLRLSKKKFGKEELIGILTQISNSIVKILGYDLKSDKGKNAQAILYLILKHCAEKSINLNSFEDLSNLVLSLPEDVKNEGEVFFEKKEMLQLAKKLKYLTIGEKSLIFQYGVPLDINLLLGKGKGKTQISIIYLNSLKSSEEKMFFLSILATQLYQWMLENPSKKLQAIFMIDEISPFIPAGAEKPVTKEILKLIFKQARKYGIGCIVGTQNPGDIDYKAFSQFGTWAIGRLTTRQDIKKVSIALKSLSTKKMFEKLPKLKPGEFLVFSPDAYKKVKEIKVRWLMTEHRTLMEDEVKKLMERFKGEYNIKKKGKELKPKKEGFETIKTKLDLKEIGKIAEKRKRRLFVIFGPEKEKIESIKLKLLPVLKFDVVKKKRRLFGEALEKRCLLFNGLNGNIIRLKGDSQKEFNSGKLIGLTERELSVVKELSKKGRLTNAELAERLKITENFVNKLVNGLMKKGLIIRTGKAGRANIWDLAVSFKIPKIKKADSKIETFSCLKGEIIKAKIKNSDIQRFIQGWYGFSVIGCSKIYYPFYEIYYVGKKRRTLKLSAINGKELKW